MRSLLSGTPYILTLYENVLPTLIPNLVDREIGDFHSSVFTKAQEFPRILFKMVTSH